MEELKGRARAHQDGLATAFDPLREDIERLKSSFWENNRKLVKAAAEKYVELKVKERVAVEVSYTSSRPLTPCRFNRNRLQVEKALKRYRASLAENEQNNQKLKAIMDVS
jgi:hypothetical protein